VRKIIEINTNDISKVTDRCIDQLLKVRYEKLVFWICLGDLTLIGLFMDSSKRDLFISMRIIDGDRERPQTNTINFKSK